MDIKLSDLVQSNLNVRKDYFVESVEDLATSIEEDGLISRIVIRPNDEGKYEVLAGGRRTRALKLIHEDNPDFVLPKDYYIVKEMNDFEGLCLSVAENVQRTSFSTDELKDAVRIMKGLKPAITNKEIAKKFWESEARIKRVVGVEKDYDEIPDRVREEFKKCVEEGPGFTDAHWEVVRKNGGVEALPEPVIKDVCDYIIDNEVAPSNSQSVVDRFMAKSVVTKGDDPDTSTSAGAGSSGEDSPENPFEDKIKGELTLIEEDGKEMIYLKTKKEDIPVELELYREYLKNPEKFRVFVQGKITIKPVE